jgi:hypothetical protein
MARSRTSLCNALSTRTWPTTLCKCSPHHAPGCARTVAGTSSPRHQHQLTAALPPVVGTGALPATPATTREPAAGVCPLPLAVPAARCHIRLPGSLKTPAGAGAPMARRSGVAPLGRPQSSPGLGPPVPIHEVDGEQKGTREAQAGGQGRQPGAGHAPAQCLAPVVVAAASTVPMAGGSLAHSYPSTLSLETGRVWSAANLEPGHGGHGGHLIPLAGSLGTQAEPLAHPATWSSGGARSTGGPLGSPRAMANLRARRSMSTRR